MFQAWGAETDAMPIVHEPIHAPEFQRGEWFNAPALTMASLRGRVVLVHFWCYTCISCLHTLPYLWEWWRRYRDVGLVIVGIHTPEFFFEKQRANLRAAIERYAIPYPVLSDSENRNWSVWANRYWPSQYLVDERGYLHFFHFGEGHYQEIEAAIRNCCAGRPPTGSSLRCCPPCATRICPTLFAITRRRNCFSAPRAVASAINRPSCLNGRLAARCRRHSPRRPSTWTDYGAPRRNPSSSTARESFSLIYHGKEVNLVAQPPDGETGYLLLEQDNRPLARNALGQDAVPEDARVVTRVDTARMYPLVNNPRYGEHLLRVRVLTPGLALYSLSFVTECIREERTMDQAA